MNWKGLVSSYNCQNIIVSIISQVVGLMRETVRMMNEVEAKFTSVERLNHYIEVCRINLNSNYNNKKTE